MVCERTLWWGVRCKALVRIEHGRFDRVSPRLFESFENFEKRAGGKEHTARG
jgi:hypothetical protein